MEKGRRDEFMCNMHGEVMMTVRAYDMTDTEKIIPIYRYT